MDLNSDEKIIDDNGLLVVHRIIKFSVCRCRQCDDTCMQLSEPPRLLCVHCNNTHSQKADPKKFFSEYLGPLSGPRKAKRAWLKEAYDFLNRLNRGEIHFDEGTQDGDHISIPMHHAAFTTKLTEAFTEAAEKAVKEHHDAGRSV